MSSPTPSDDAPGRTLSTGVSGLDEILRGGIAAKRLYLLEGQPGSGKTTLGLQFLMAGAARGERALLVTLSESAEELRAIAASHGWDLDGIEVLEFLPSADELMGDGRYTMFHPAEVELGDTVKSLLGEFDRIEPNRVVIDSVSELRLLADSPLRYRREILALKDSLSHHQATVFLVDDRTTPSPDMRLHTLSHGAIRLGWETSAYGPMQRSLQITKMRGRGFSEGLHDFTIRAGGLEVFPRLVAAEHRMQPRLPGEALPSGSEALDALLGGGLARGTSALIVGPAGVGKSTLAGQYVDAAAKRGESSCIFLFDENVGTYFQRCAGLEIDIAGHVERGVVEIRQIDPAAMSPGEFAWHARRAADDAAVVVIDSLTGYLQAMPDQRFLSLHLHELLTHLSQQGVTTLLVVGQHGAFGSETEAAIDASYLADAVILMRNFESGGVVRQAISIAKRRTGPHERTLREFRIDRGIQLGETLRDLEGVLTGWPRAVTRSTVDSGD